VLRSPFFLLVTASLVSLLSALPDIVYYASKGSWEVLLSDSAIFKKKGKLHPLICVICLYLYIHIAVHSSSTLVNRTHTCINSEP
jgi:hypothetical protein